MKLLYNIRMEKMNVYDLMNKEQPILSFYITEEYGEKMAYQDECFVQPSFLPVGFSDIQRDRKSVV